jgi:ribosome-associated translation inhibitor RaiA
MDPNKALESEVRAWMDRLSPLTDATRMMSGHMVIESVERKGTQRHSGMRYGVHLELTTLDTELVIELDQEGNTAHEDVYVAIRNAFRLLRRQLVAEQERRRPLSDVDTIVGVGVGVGVAIDDGGLPAERGAN